MFDFEKLTSPYIKRQNYFRKNTNNLLLQEKTIGNVITNQSLNIAEDTSRYRKADHRNFYLISRGAVFECVAIFDILKEEGILPIEKFQQSYKESEALSKWCLP